jgi:hypothetical protein
MELQPRAHTVGRSRRWLAPLVMAGVASVAMGVSPVSAATPYGSNLLRNPGAQAGGASSNGQSPVAIPSWDTFANMTVVKYGTSGFPSTNQGARFDGGSRFFSSGPYDSGLGTCGSAEQRIVISGRGGAIDSGRVKVYLKGRVAAGGSSTVAHLDVYFRDSENHTVSSNGIVRSVNGTGSSFRSISASRTLPRDTRILRVRLWADNVSAGYCKAYFDKLSVVIKRI